MKNFSKIMWGLALIVIGIILGGNALGLFSINIFFKGWWTLFIIVPSFIGLFSNNDKTGNIIGLLVGIALLLASRGVFDFNIIWKLLVPFIIISIGLSLIFKNSFDRETNESIKKLNEKISSGEGITATFSGQNVEFEGEEFKGTTLNAVFGGIKLDLRKAKIKDDVVINATSVFGGIDILVPEDCKVKIKSNSIFGGVSNNKKTVAKEKAHTIYVNGSGIFGGIEVK